MPTFSSFDRTTLKLLVAAFFALNGVSVATAQDVAGADPMVGLHGVVLDPPAAPMSAESLAAHPTCIVYANGRRVLIQGAALHDGPAAVAVLVLDADGRGELHATTAGDGGFFSLEVAAPHRAVSADVSVDGQPDAVAECTRPNVAPLSGLGLGGVAITNSTPAAETTEHVEQAVDAYNLF